MHPDRWLSVVRMRLRSLLRRARVENELERELRSHLAHERSARPLAPSYTAIRRLGGVAQIQEECRDMRRTNFIDNFVRDLHYAFRTLAKAPGFALVIVLTLALGIGANTTVFSVMNATLLQRLPYRDGDRLALLWQVYGNDRGPNNWGIVSAPNFWDIRDLSHSFESMAIFDSSGRGYNLAPVPGLRQAEQVSGLRVSAGFFSVLGVAPLLGRTFTADEERLDDARKVVLSYGLWKDRYGADPALVGHEIPIDGVGYTVIGVMPPQFHWQFWGPPRQLWVPVGYTKTDFGRGDNSFLCIAKLKRGVTMAQANAEVDSIARALAERFPKLDTNLGAELSPLEEAGIERFRGTLTTLLAAVVFVLLIACVNVANLLLAKGATRQKEFAIRLALGAPGSRIARQLLTESLLLAIAGGVGGLLLAVWSNRLLFYGRGLDELQLTLRPVDSVPIDGRVFAFALLVSGLTGLLFGLAPALGALRAGINDPLKEGGRGQSTGSRGRLRYALVASEVALAVVVLSGAGLMIKSMSRLLGVEPGLNPRNVLTFSMSTPQDEIYVGPPNLPRYCQDLSERAGAIPGVLSVGAIAHLPFRGNAGRGFQIEGKPPAKPGSMPGASYSVACPGYFRTMGIPILRGREFTAQDALGAPGAIVINEEMARTYWPNEDPIGRAIRLGGVSGPRLTIVGVAGNVRFQGLDSPMRRQFFRPYMQAGWPIMNVVARTAGAPLTFAAPVKKALAEALPELPVSDVTTMEDVLRDSTGGRRFPMLMLSVFSALALVLAAVGIIGVVGHSVAQRTQEIGIRMALGASSTDVLRLTLEGGMIWVLGGLAAGLAGTALMTRALTQLLFGVRPLDPAVLASVSLLLALVSLAATYIPARRAARIDPVIALRGE